MPKPNFVIIMTDTQATNIVGCYGHPGMETPNIDQLAERGKKFLKAYTTCPLCTPARAGLFSGIYSHTSGPWTNNLPFGDNIKTMGQRFQDLGYHTAYTGKWHLDGHDYFGTGICPPGWDANYWFDGKRYLEELTESEIHLWRNGLNSLEDLKRHQISAEFTWAHRVSNRAIDFLKKFNSDPFVLVVSYDEPHHPFTCPPEYVEKFQNFEYFLGLAGLDTLEGKPSHQREWSRSFGNSITGERVRHPLYFGCNSFVDHEIGRVIEAIHQYSPENTYIIYTSDHGDMLGAHQLRGKGPAAYQEITNIPLIIEQPGSRGAGTVNRTPVSHIDLLPTMLELAGGKVVPILEGSSITNLLEGQEEKDRAVVIEFNRYEIEHDSFGGYQPLRCIVGQRFKLVINLLSEDELYDLENDPAEVHNLIDDDQYRDIRDELHDRLLNWMYEKRDPFRGAYWERRPWRKSRKLEWRGKFRPRPDDGYAPPVLDYDTGLPSRGVKVEFGQNNVDRLEK